MKLLIDTNVILDALMRRDPFDKAAEMLLLAAAEEKFEGYFTASAVMDLYYLLKKHVRDHGSAKQILLNLMAVINVLEVTRIDCEKAFEINMLDYEDALQAQCAKRAKADYIVTRNKKHFERSLVQAISPDDAVKIISQGGVSR